MNVYMLKSLIFSEGHRKESVFPMLGCDATLTKETVGFGNTEISLGMHSAYIMLLGAFPMKLISLAVHCIDFILLFNMQSPHYYD